MGLVITVEDQASPWLKWAMHQFPDYQRQALKSAGWYGQKEIKAGIRSGAPGGHKYKERMPAKKRAKLERRKSSRFPWFGKLVQAIGYQYLDAQGTVVIGWLSPSAVRLGQIHEGGTNRVVTPETRRRYFAAGIGISKKIIQVPKRPTIEPMAAELAPKWAPYIEGKIRSYIERDGRMTFSSPSSRRKYVVKGSW
jgi:hypothetical protein